MIKVCIIFSIGVIGALFAFFVNPTPLDACLPENSQQCINDYNVFFGSIMLIAFIPLGVYLFYSDRRRIKP